MDAAANDRQFAIEVARDLNANPRRCSARTASKPTPMPVPPALRKGRASRLMSAKKSTQKVSEAKDSTKSTTAKRGRPPKNATGDKKTAPKRKPAGIRKHKTVAVSKPRSRVIETPDIVMHDVDDVIGAPSPSSSDLSDVSSFALSSSASSRSSPEPSDGHLVDEAEKNDLIESAAMRNTNAQVPIQDLPVLDNAVQVVTSSAPIPSSPDSEAIQSLGKKRTAQGSLRPNALARRNKENRTHLAIGFSFIGPVGPIQQSLQQESLVPPFANLDARNPIQVAPQWIGADHSEYISQQDPAQHADNNIGYGISGMMQPVNTPQFHAPGDEPKARAQPRAMGEPPVWADKRQQLCETLPYYNAYQSGVYMSSGIIYGMLIDAESRQNDVFNQEVIITRCGGGRGGADLNGRRAQAMHQQSSPIGLAFERARINKIAIVVIAGANYRNSEHMADFLPHRYNILAHFHVTDVWLELNDNFQTYCCRMEKINLQDQSWWVSEPYAPRNYGLYVPIYSCRRCHAGSKCIYAQGWVCLNINCPSYFKLVDEVTGYEATLISLVYSSAFLFERTPYTGIGALAPLVPALISREDMLLNARSGTEEVFTKGIVCPRCKCCSRRTDFKKWTCENLNGCDFSYELPVRILTAQQAQPEGVSNAAIYPVLEDGVKRSSQAIGHFDVDEFEIPGLNGQIVGYVRHFKSNALVNALKDGPDDLFRDMQGKDFGLMRRPVRQKGHSGEILTSHYASNWGAPYKFVVSQLSKPFAEAPEVIIKALKKMTWAGERSLSNAGPAFQQFNELLSIGYLENTRIGYHDDGEKELGPTIATLSLGSQAEMSLRAKRGAPEGIGRSRNNQRGTKAEALKILLNHGDIVIMHGVELQKYYEHAVNPRGTLRYALTCRTILPERLENEAERAEAARLAKLPGGHEAWNYNGEEICQQSEEEKQKAKSNQMVSALQRTLDDLHTMLQHSSIEELTQISGVDEVIGAYRRVMTTATRTAAALTEAAASSSTTDGTALAAVANSDISGGAYNGYDLVSPDQPAAEVANSEDELVDAVNDVSLN